MSSLDSASPSRLVKIVALATLALGCAPSGAYPQQPPAIHSTVAINDVNLHIAEMGEGPLVLFLHGFPELWYSWRHQLPVVAAAGYRAVALDMRGFGGSDQPEHLDAYNIRELCADITGLIDHFGEETAVIVGHDWGAAVNFYCAQLIPDRYRGMVTMSVPYGGPRSDTPPLHRLRELYGDRFFYMLYFQSDAAELELDGRVDEVFRKLMVTPGTEREDARINNPLADAGGFLDRIGYPKAESTWITAAERQYYVDVFEKTGFLGGLNYYRNLDNNWHTLQEASPKTMDKPAIFIGGAKDFLVGGQSTSELENRMRTVTPQITAHVIPEAGHWIQNEKADLVNEILVNYLRSLETATDAR